MKDVVPGVRETTVKLPSVGDESSGSIHYPLQFLCCGLRRTSQQAIGVIMKAWTKTATVSSSSDRRIYRSWSSWKKHSLSSTTPRALSKKFVTQMLMRDLFAVAYLLVNCWLRNVWLISNDERLMRCITVMTRWMTITTNDYDHRRRCHACTNSNKMMFSPFTKSLGCTVCPFPARKCKSEFQIWYRLFRN